MNLRQKVRAKLVSDARRDALERCGKSVRPTELAREMSEAEHSVTEEMIEQELRPLNWQLCEWVINRFSGESWIGEHIRWVAWRREVWEEAQRERGAA